MKMQHRALAVAAGLTAFALAGAAGTARGQALITGETAAASSAIGQPFDRVPARAVDDSGLTAGDNLASTPDQTHTDVPDGFMWLSSGEGFGGTDPNPTYTVNLGGLYDLTGVRVFNYNENSGNPGLFTGRGVQTTNVLVSQDGTNFTQLNPVGSPITLPRAPGNNGYTGDFFDLVQLTGGPVRARAIQFDILSNYGGDANFYGLSELQFDGTLVPEPTSLGLLALGGLAALRRRRRAS